MTVIFLLICFASLIGVSISKEGPLVETPLGKIRGFYETSFNGRNFSSFEGIRYAKSPIGELRFEEVQPVEPWKGIWNAHIKVTCAQYEYYLTQSVIGVEDCLYVNVYVPKTNSNPKDNLNVIIHVHGGAFMLGSSYLYTNPYYLMDKDIIFVTFNYRVGILGFLSTEDEIVPGNNGLKDQVLAMKWIKKNIASFGGNPESITLTGLSAGAASAHFHYLSPLSKGLFHRGFSQSGVALNAFSIQDQPLKKAKIVGESLECPTNSTQDLVDCLKALPVNQILEKIPLFIKYKITPPSPFAPVVERKCNDGAFLRYNPLYYLSQGLVNDVPWLVSNTADEDYVFTEFMQNELKEVNDQWAEIAPFLLDFGYTLSKSLWNETSYEIKDYYLGKDEDINSLNVDKLTKIISDRTFLFDAETAIKWQAKVNKSPVYYFIFSYSGENNTGKVAHGSDARYYFQSNYLEDKLTGNDLKMKDLCINMLVSYAETGKPEFSGVIWEPTSYNELTFLNISDVDDIKLQVVEELTPRTFWKSRKFLENYNLVIVDDEL